MFCIARAEAACPTPYNGYYYVAYPHLCTRTDK